MSAPVPPLPDSVAAKLSNALAAMAEPPDTDIAIAWAVIGPPQCQLDSSSR